MAFSCDSTRKEEEKVMKKKILQNRREREVCWYHMVNIMVLICVFEIAMKKEICGIRRYLKNNLLRQFKQ